MLDDLKYIHQRDTQDALGITERQWQQLQHSFEPAAENSEFKACENIVYAGMGGSALAALISKSWPGWRHPFEVCRQYQIPGYVSEKTLFIASSASGNTEETLAALAAAEAKAAKIIIMAGGGQLQKIAEQKSYPFLLLPSASQPRYGVLYNLKALATTADFAGLSVEQDAAGQLAQAADFLRQAAGKWTAVVPTAQNPTKQLALELAGKSTVIYAGPLMAPVAYKWKINFNENAKSVAWWNELPEFNHNEFIGWSGHPIQKPYGVVELRSNLEHERVQKRFELSNKLLSGKKPAPEVVQLEGNNLLEQMLWGIAYGDFVSIYLALLNGVNPAPVDLVEKFKTELNQ